MYAQEVKTVDLSTNENSQEMASKSSTVKRGDGIDNTFKLNRCIEVSRPLCTICSDRSSGFHYGTHACEGCKGFFRRMVTNIILGQSLLQCTGVNKYKCDINSVTRNNCQRCRLQKCFQLGMTRYKTRLGRRTKASADKIESIVNIGFVFTVLNDDEMSKCIKRESRYFNNNESDDDEPSGKCIKHKAKLYSEKNSKCYQTYLKNNSRDFTNNSKSVIKIKVASIKDVGSENGFFNDTSFEQRNYNSVGERINSKAGIGHENNYFGISNFDINESRAMDFTQNFLNSLSPISNITMSPTSHSECSGFHNKWIKKRNNDSIYTIPDLRKRTPMFESIRLYSEKLQIDKMCVKIRIFLAYDLDNEDFMRLNHYKQVISTLNHDFFHPSIKEVDKLWRSRLHNIKINNNPESIFCTIKEDMTGMCKNIIEYFKRLPDLELFQRLATENPLVKRKIVQTLVIWMLKFVNVSENILYNPKLSVKIPFSLLTQSPLTHFFETLFHLADLANSILNDEIDDTELSFISLLIITFPKKGFLYCSENMLQSDNYLKVRFLYSALLYEYMLTEKFNQNIDHTETRFQKFCWLINQCHLLQERDINYIFSYLNL